MILAFFLLASWTLAGSAHASYGQFRLDGVGLILAFLLIVAYGLCVDLALVARTFRSRVALVVGSIIPLALVSLFLFLLSTSTERAGLFDTIYGGWGFVFVVTTAVYLPFIVIAPFAQYRSMRHGVRWPRWITAWMALQLALYPTFKVLTVTDRHYREQESVAGEAVGRRVAAGELGALLERAEQRRERIWGLKWTYPWPQPSPAEMRAGPSGWIVGLAKGMEASALIATDEPLRAPDRAALQKLVDRHFSSYGGPHIQAKLLWDTLEPSGFSRQLAPRGVEEVETPSEEVIPVLLERLEKYGAVRLCPGGRMMDADRAVLQALILVKGRAWNTETRVYDMRPEWVAYQRRVERLCTGPE